MTTMYHCQEGEAWFSFIFIFKPICHLCTLGYNATLDQLALPHLTFPEDEPVPYRKSCPHARRPTATAAALTPDLLKQKCRSCPPSLPAATAFTQSTIITTTSTTTGTPDPANITAVGDSGTFSIPADPETWVCLAEGCRWNLGRRACV